MNTDNQQEIGLIGWLAGIIDGEGTISLTITERSERKQMIRTTPKVVIANTDAALIEQCIKAMDVIGVGRYIRHERKPARQVCGNHVKVFKPVTMIEVFGFKRVLKLLKAVQPYLAGEKANRAELLIAFIVGRIGYADQQKKAQNLAYRKEDVDRALAFMRVTKTKRYDRIAKILNEHTREPGQIGARRSYRSRCALDSRESVRGAGKSVPAA